MAAVPLRVLGEERLDNGLVKVRAVAGGALDGEVGEEGCSGHFLDGCLCECVYV